MTSNPPSRDLEQELEQKLESIQVETRDTAAAQRAQELGLPFSDLKTIPIDPDTLSLVDEVDARSAGVALIHKTGNNVIVAALDPKSPAAEKVIKSLRERGFTLKIIMTSPTGLRHAWERYGSIKKAAMFEVGAIELDEAELSKLQAEINDLDDLKNKVTQISVTKLLEILVAGALKTQASDIHFEPEMSGTRLRYRLDGLLQNITLLDNNYYSKALNRIKILSKLKLNIHTTPQDGRFTIRQGSVDIEVRVSILPSEFGETVVMRLLDPRTIRNTLESLGMRDDILVTVKEQLKRSNGAILTTGPTGSGKTTTLYAFVNYLNASDTKVITIEDPIEYHIAGISQTQVDVAKGYTFANGLRAIVRQDPDIILVGEIRDTETADIALHASLTGHLVFSTIHTNDAAGTIPRLLDLGIKPQTIAPAINIAMGQRLLRRLCGSCKIKDSPSPEHLARIKEQLEPIKKRFSLPDLDESLAIYYPGKCADCNGLGYKSRVGVYEIFVISKAMEKLILSSPAVSDIKELAVKEGMVTMMQDGFLKLIEGTTSLEEIERVLM
jgi:type II secretory ATPase GspE/PulE/Tfp pilus assembly ATPase PilB-like protein